MHWLEKHHRRPLWKSRKWIIKIIAFSDYNPYWLAAVFPIHYKGVKLWLLNFFFLLTVCSVLFDCLQPHRVRHDWSDAAAAATPWREHTPARLLCAWDFPGKNTGVGCCFPLQGTFLTQGSNPCLFPLLCHLGRLFFLLVGKQKLLYSI